MESKEMKEWKESIEKEITNLKERVSLLEKDNEFLEIGSND